MSNTFKETPEEMVREADLVFKLLIQDSEKSRVIMERIIECQTKLEAYVSGYHLGFGSCMKEVSSGRLTLVQNNNE